MYVQMNLVVLSLIFFLIVVVEGGCILGLFKRKISSKSKQASTISEKSKQSNTISEKSKQSNTISEKSKQSSTISSSTRSSTSTLESNIFRTRSGRENEIIRAENGLRNNRIENGLQDNRIVNGLQDSRIENGLQNNRIENGLQDIHRIVNGLQDINRIVDSTPSEQFMSSNSTLNSDTDNINHSHNVPSSWPLPLHRIDCFHENIKDEKSCLKTGCCWNPVPKSKKADVPWCFYSKLFVKVNCLPYGDVTREKCLAKGCHWNKFNNGGTSCFYPPNYKTHRTDLPQCMSDTFTSSDRKQCPGEKQDTRTESGCIQAGCCWSPLYENSQEPWCFLPWNVVSKGELQEPRREQCPADKNQRFNCFPRSVENKLDCNARGCCWVPSQGSHPSCYYPTNYKSYVLDKIILKDEDSGVSVTYKKQIDSPYPDDMLMVQMDIEYETNTRVRVKISDPSKSRYESIYPKISKRNIYTTSESTRKYKISFDTTQRSGFGFAIERKDSNKMLFDTRNVGGFTMSDQFLQISANLGSRFVYGLGEVSKKFLTDFNWKTFKFFAKSQNPAYNFYPEGNYGSHPFYLAMESDGNSSTGTAHGVLLLNSNSLEVELQPKASITYRATGGILDFYFFLGQTPSDVIEQYLELIGKPNLPPYWSLGFQLSKSAWKGLDDMKTVVSRTLNNSIPLDVVYGGIDYRHKSRADTSQSDTDWTTQLLPEYVATLHSQGIKFVSIFDPTIEPNKDQKMFTSGSDLDVFVKQYSTELFTEKFLNSSAVYIDFTNPKVDELWHNILAEFRSKLPFDGVILDYNEPSTIQRELLSCPLTKFDDPPFVPQSSKRSDYELNQNTLCMSATQYSGLHYNLHNLYGIAQSEVTYSALSKMLTSRPFIVSRSTFPGSGQYVAHWTGDVYSDWSSMRQSITDMLLMNMFGVPMVGADICGFNSDTTTELCARWSALGAFYPLSRNNNNKNFRDHDPADPSRDSNAVLHSARSALLTRYELIPYLYTLLHKAHRFGHTVVRPMFFENPEDVATYTMDKQFLWGSALAVVPVLEENQTTVEAYLPGTWYTYPNLDKKYETDIWDGSGPVPLITLNANITEIPLLIRDGSIIVLQTPGDNLVKSRENGFKILIILNRHGIAEGEMYWDNGDTLDPEAYNHILFFTEGNTIKIYNKKFNYKVSMPIDHITVVGVPSTVHYIKINQNSTVYKLITKNKFNMLEIDTRGKGFDLRDKIMLEIASPSWKARRPTFYFRPSNLGQDN